MPNADTQEALRQAATGDDLVEYDGLDDLKAKFRRRSRGIRPGRKGRSEFRF